MFLSVLQEPNGAVRRLHVLHLDTCILCVSITSRYEKFLHKNGGCRNLCDLTVGILGVGSIGQHGEVLLVV